MFFAMFFVFFEKTMVFTPFLWCFFAVFATFCGINVANKPQSVAKTLQKCDK